MNDEGFREIQLNGKQLVFLFMAATVVSVLIFLFGVMVGRGAKPSSAGVAGAEIAADAAAPPADPSPSPSASSAPPSGTALPPAPADELTYPDRLQRNTPVQETLKPPAPVQDSAGHHAPAPTPPPPDIPAAVSTPLVKSAQGVVSEPPGPGYVVQVAAPQDRQAAETLAKQLIAKGYPAFVMDPMKGAPKQLYRVRVGKYKNRKEAEEVASRLEKVEGFAPWIAR
jgi:cell division protein FtsN